MSVNISNVTDLCCNQSYLSPMISRIESLNTKNGARKRDVYNTKNGARKRDVYRAKRAYPKGDTNAKTGARKRDIYRAKRAYPKGDTMHHKPLSFKHAPERLHREKRKNFNDYAIHSYPFTHSHSIITELLSNVVTTCSNQRISHLHDMAEQLSTDKNEIHSNKMLMESQITQLNGQKQIIATLNNTINDLCGKVKEYEHHIHRLTLQLKQLSLINQATQQTNTDFNVQQIQTLSHQLMEKEIELDAIKHQVEIKDNTITDMDAKMREIQNALNIKGKEWREVAHKYDHLKQEMMINKAKRDDEEIKRNRNDVKFKLTQLYLFLILKCDFTRISLASTHQIPTN
eukprot:681757_1